MKDIIKDDKYITDRNFASLSYDELSSWEVGKAVIKAAVNRWSALGFLEGISDNVKKEKLAIAFDNMANDLLKENSRVVELEKRYNFNCKDDNENSKQSFEFDTIVFPILRWVICGPIGEEGGTEYFNYKKFLDYLEYYSFLAINYDGYNKDSDIEAEFCSILAIIIKRKFDKEKNKQ